MVLAAPSSAGHPNGLCDDSEGWHGDNAETFLDIQWINISYWGSTHDYTARRYNSAFDVTYQQYVAGGGQHTTNTSNGFDFYRRTSIQRAGYTTVSYFERQYSHTNC